eukprot:TRINITY_DN844_c0_g4_i2.p1 TRINITY_DN844_c0_g4~~TRINITY_DN844_c0_g4_i2.p1  ORF type:complete len:157 (+),score=14.78 TRINITY_DN844_c0_g4_i2:162-632(+)
MAKECNYLLKRAWLNFDANDLVGEGSFGIVYKGTYLNTPVAIKKIKMNMQSNEMMKYVERELDMIIQLHHPHIVELMGICVTGTEVLIVTEFIRGADLEQRLQDPKIERIPWGTRVNVALQISLVLLYLHSGDRIHRDIKPSNVLVGMIRFLINVY